MKVHIVLSHSGWGDDISVRKVFDTVEKANEYADSIRRSELEADRHNFEKEDEEDFVYWSPVLPFVVIKEVE